MSDPGKTSAPTASSTTIIVVNWNGSRWIRQCLDSVAALDHAPRGVVIVDNGSVDDSIELARAHGVTCVILRNDENLGFAAACNRGMHHALDDGAGFVFLLNNDATLRPDTLDRLLDAAERESRAGLLAGKILTADGRVWCAGVDVGAYPNLQRLRGRGARDDGRWAREENVTALTGCGLLIRRDVLEEVGFFDDDFFVYVEDIDLSLRARASGWQCRYVPDAVMVHYASASTGGGYGPWRKYMVAYNVVTFLKKHGSAAMWGAFILFEIVGWPLLLLISIPRGRVSGALAKARGTWSALLGRPMHRPEAPMGTLAS